MAFPCGNTSLVLGGDRRKLRIPARDLRTTIVVAVRPAERDVEALLVDASGAAVGQIWVSFFRESPGGLPARFGRVEEDVVSRLCEELVLSGWLDAAPDWEMFDVLLEAVRACLVDGVRRQRNCL